MVILRPQIAVHRRHVYLCSYCLVILTTTIRRLLLLISNVVVIHIVAVSKQYVINVCMYVNPMYVFLCHPLLRNRVVGSAGNGFGAE